MNTKSRLFSRHSGSVQNQMPILFISLFALVAVFIIGASFIKKPADGAEGLTIDMPKVEAATQDNADKADTYKDWLEDADGYEKGVVDAEAKKKPLIVYFYAPWCPYCKRFDANVLSKKDVIKYMKKTVNVRIYPDKGMDRERAIMQDFGATGFPTFFVKHPGGEFVEVEAQSPDEARYRTPEEFIEAIKNAK